MRKLTIGLGLMALVAPAVLVSGPASASTASDVSPLKETVSAEAPESSKLDQIVDGAEADPKRHTAEGHRGSRRNRGNRELWQANRSRAGSRDG